MQMKNQLHAASAAVQWLHVTEAASHHMLALMRQYRVLATMATPHQAVAFVTSCNGHVTRPYGAAILPRRAAQSPGICLMVCCLPREA